MARRTPNTTVITMSDIEEDYFQGGTWSQIMSEEEGPHAKVANARARVSRERVSANDTTPE